MSEQKQPFTRESMVQKAEFCQKGENSYQITIVFSYPDGFRTGDLQHKLMNALEYVVRVFIESLYINPREK